MTIFDSLRYSLSNPPTLEELNSLPTSIIDQWVSILAEMPLSNNAYNGVLGIKELKEEYKRYESTTPLQRLAYNLNIKRILNDKECVTVLHKVILNYESI